MLVSAQCQVRGLAGYVLARGCLSQIEVTTPLATAGAVCCGYLVGNRHAPIGIARGSSPGQSGAGPQLPRRLIHCVVVVAHDAGVGPVVEVVGIQPVAAGSEHETVE